MDMLIANWPIVGFVFLVLLGIMAGKSATVPESPPYQRRDGLMSPGELRFYHVLRTACGDDLLAFSKVRIADVLAVKPNTQKAIGWQNRINSKHIDFVICDAESLAMISAIELDDKSHQRPERMQRDQFVNAAFKAAQFPLLRIAVQRDYDAEAIRLQIIGDGKKQAA